MNSATWWGAVLFGVGFVVALGILFSVSFAFAAGTNLVANGDLEAGSGSLPTSWTQDSWGTLTAVFSYPALGNGSAKAAKVQLTKYTSGDAKWMFNHIPVVPGTTYTFSDDYSATVPTNVTIEYKTSSGSFNYIWLADLPASGSSWATYTSSIVPPAGVVSMSVLHTIQSVGSLTLDNVSVTNGTGTTTPPAPTSTPPVIAKPTISSFVANPTSILVGSSTTLTWVVGSASSTSINQGIGIVTGTSRSVNPTQTTQYVLTATNPGGSVSATTTVTVTQPPVSTSTPTTTPPTSGPNLIQNGNLETGNGAVPTGWQSDYWGSLRATFTYPALGNGGGKAAKVVVTNWRSGDAKWWFTHVPVSSNTIYKYTEDYTGSVISNVTVEFKMSDGSYQYQWIANEPVASVWTPFSIEITVPRGAVSLSVLHALDKNGTLTIDNASLIALPANPFPKGMVTLSFDDGLKSQFTNARPILNTAGIKGGFYIITTEPDSGDTDYMTWANITTLKNDGHEIGGHTRTHPDLSAIPLAQAQTEIKGSFDDLVAQGFSPKAFLYPVGGVNPAVEQLVKNAGYLIARGSYWGMNSPTADEYALYDIRLDKTTTLAQAKAWIDQAVADKRWVVFELHDVLASGGDDYAISTSLFQQIVTYIKSSGIQVVTLDQGRALMQ